MQVIVESPEFPTGAPGEIPSQSRSRWPISQRPTCKMLEVWDDLGGCASEHSFWRLKMKRGMIFHGDFAKDFWGGKLHVLDPASFFDCSQRKRSIFPPWNGPIGQNIGRNNQASSDIRRSPAKVGSCRCLVYFHVVSMSTEEWILFELPVVVAFIPMFCPEFRQRNA